MVYVGAVVPDAAPVTLNWAFVVLAAPGTNRTSIVQDPPFAETVPPVEQLPPVIVYVPGRPLLLTAISLIASAVAPLLESVKVAVRVVVPVP
jgi:hypothetical protein